MRARAACRGIVEATHRRLVRGSTLVARSAPHWWRHKRAAASFKHLEHPHVAPGRSRPPALRPPCRVDRVPKPLKCLRVPARRRALRRLQLHERRRRTDVQLNLPEDEYAASSRGRQQQRARLRPRRALAREGYSGPTEDITPRRGCGRGEHGRVDRAPVRP
eukprot:649730-Prymnesium_polylepis.1